MSLGSAASRVLQFLQLLARADDRFFQPCQLLRNFAGGGFLVEMTRSGSSASCTRADADAGETGCPERAAPCRA